MRRPTGCVRYAVWLRKVLVYLGRLGGRGSRPTYYIIQAIGPLVYKPVDI